MAPNPRRSSISAAREPRLTWPLRKDDGLLGMIHILSQGRPRLPRETDRPAGNFAAQAVIAIENTRLINGASARRWSGRRRRQKCCSVINELAGQPRAGVRCDAGKRAYAVLRAYGLGYVAFRR